MSKILKKGSKTQKLKYLGNPEVTWLDKVRKLNHERGKMGWLKIINVCGFWIKITVLIQCRPAEYCLQLVFECYTFFIALVKILVTSKKVNVP